MRLLLRAPNWLGDIVMAVPSIAAVRRAHPEATLAVAAPAAVAPLLRAVRAVDEVVTLPAEGGVRALREHARLLREGRFDRVILFTNSFSTALVARLAGIPERWGYRRDARGLLLTRGVRARPRGPDSRHHSAYYRALVEALGIDGGVSRPDEGWLDPPDSWRRRAATLLDGAGVPADMTLVGIAPGAAFGGAKRWPPERVAELVGELHARTTATAVLVGASADVATGIKVESALRRHGGDAGRGPVNLIGRTDLAELAGVLSRMAAFVSNDSGAMHVAAGLGVPTVAIFGPTDEHATSPLGPQRIVATDVVCRPCHLRECPIDHRCMRRIAASQVLDAVLAMAGGRVSAR